MIMDNIFFMFYYFGVAKLNFRRFALHKKSSASSNINRVKVRIRIASVSDSEIVAGIGRMTFYETWKSVNTEEDLQLYMSSSFDPVKIKEEIINSAVSSFLLAYVDEELAGYAKLRNDRTYEQLAGTRSLELERIYVLKKYQDHKVGKALMDESIRLARNGKYVWLWLGVNEENLMAINFYKRYGFEVFGTKKFILGTAIDEDFLMKKPITNASGE